MSNLLPPEDSEACAGHVHVSQVIVGYSRANVKGPKAFMYDLIDLPTEAMVEHHFFPNKEEAEVYASSLITPTDAPDAISIMDVRVELN